MIFYYLGELENIEFFLEVVMVVVELIFLFVVIEWFDGKVIYEWEILFF